MEINYTNPAYTNISDKKEDKEQTPLKCQIAALSIVSALCLLMSTSALVLSIVGHPNYTCKRDHEFSFDLQNYMLSSHQNLSWDILQEHVTPLAAEIDEVRRIAKEVEVQLNSTIIQQKAQGQHLEVLINSTGDGLQNNIEVISGEVQFWKHYIEELESMFKNFSMQMNQANENLTEHIELYKEESKAAENQLLAQLASTKQKIVENKVKMGLERNNTMEMLEQFLNQFDDQLNTTRIVLHSQIDDLEHHVYSTGNETQQNFELSSQQLQIWQNHIEGEIEELDEHFTAQLIDTNNNLTEYVSTKNEELESVDDHLLSQLTAIQRAVDTNVDTIQLKQNATEQILKHVDKLSFQLNFTRQRQQDLETASEELEIWKTYIAEKLDHSARNTTTWINETKDETIEYINHHIDQLQLADVQIDSQLTTLQQDIRSVESEFLTEKNATTSKFENFRYQINETKREHGYSVRNLSAYAGSIRTDLEASDYHLSIRINSTRAQLNLLQQTSQVSFQNLTTQVQISNRTVAMELNNTNNELGNVVTEMREHNNSITRYMRNMEITNAKLSDIDSAKSAIQLQISVAEQNCYSAVHQLAEWANSTKLAVQVEQDDFELTVNRSLQVMADMSLQLQQDIEVTTESLRNVAIAVRALNNSQQRINQSLTHLTTNLTQLRTDTTNLNTSRTVHHAPDCPGTYQYNPFSGTCYKHISLNKNWADAKQYCESNGGHLATLDSRESLDWMNSTIHSAPGFFISYHWFGGQRTSTGFMWRGRLSGNIRDELWYPGYPTADSNDDCVEALDYSSGYRLSNYHCSAEQHFVCEKETL